jgi:hypothetical protein
MALGADSKVPAAKAPPLSFARARSGPFDWAHASVCACAHRSGENRSVKPGRWHSFAATRTWPARLSESWTTRSNLMDTQTLGAKPGDHYYQPKQPKRCRDHRRLPCERAQSSRRRRGAYIRKTPNAYGRNTDLARSSVSFRVWYWHKPAEVPEANMSALEGNVLQNYFGACARKRAQNSIPSQAGSRRKIPGCTDGVERDSFSYSDGRSSFATHSRVKRTSPWARRQVRL